MNPIGERGFASYKNRRESSVGAATLAYSAVVAPATKAGCGDLATASANRGSPPTGYCDSPLTVRAGVGELWAVGTGSHRDVPGFRYSGAGEKAVKDGGGKGFGGVTVKREGPVTGLAELALHAARRRAL